MSRGKTGKREIGEVCKGPLASKIDLFLTDMARNGFGGTVLIAEGDDVVLNKGFGLSREGIRCTASTVFDIGSITKQFTATAILRLEEEGLVSVNDSISKYFDHVPEDKARITIHHLLTHTAGLLHSYGEDYEIAFRDETLKKMFEQPLKFQPGTAYSYSNGGYSVLAALIERVTGRSFEEYLRSTFFDPLGMRYTGYSLPEQLKVPVVMDKSRKDGPYWYLYGNGGLLSTTGDLFRWHLALHGGEVLSELQKKRLFIPYVKTDEGTSFYGYGWFIDMTSRGTTLISHSGESGEGINSDFLYYKDEDILMIIFSDVRLNSKIAVDVVEELLEEIIFG